ncbi:hypothetical protein EYF80_010741 [Liparis tanakae]|uniref:Uncharacterized protein n=1 Tax=Liparis tanakae TaxID=230148 RepID=A0A4Z2IPB9_9TELE|nr:hypothetical protein EYF80_010741 [Liparis tanakae]
MRSSHASPSRPRLLQLLLFPLLLEREGRKLLLSSGCSSSKLRLDQLPRLSSPTLSCWDTDDSVASLPGRLKARSHKAEGVKKGC